MDYITFKKCLEINRDYSATQIQESKMSLVIYIQYLEEKKKDYSNDIRRMMYFFEANAIQKKEEISTIDEVYLPEQIRFLAPGKTGIFKEVKIKAMEQIKTLRTKKERISKDFQGQQMQIKKAAMTLGNIYVEIDNSNKNLSTLSSSQIVNAFLSQNDIEIADSILDEAEMERLFNRFGVDG